MRVYCSFDQPAPSIVDLYEKGIAVNSLSKTYSIPSIRVGWVASNTKVANILRDYRDYTMICAGVFDDMVATHLFWKIKKPSWNVIVRL